MTPCNGPGGCEVIPEQHPCPGPRGPRFCGWWLSCPVPRSRSGCFLSGRWNQRLRGEQRKENCKGQGRLLQLMATLCPLSVELFQVFGRVTPALQPSR